MKHVLVTGGAGYIGSHTCLALLAAGCEVTIVDDLSHSDRSVIERIGRLGARSVAFVEADVRDCGRMRRVFGERPVDAVIHLAGLKVAGESVAEPLRYYDCNVGGTLALCRVMAERGVRTLVFSSSAMVYGTPASLPIREDFPLATTNPYGTSKVMIETLLADLAQAEPDWRIARLRYFNPVGAHESGLLGELPGGTANNLMPSLAQVASGARACFPVFGGDYPTPDGSAVRDYLHVMDLAEGHVAALDYLRREPGLMTVNLGAGRGYSVLDMVHAFEQASGRAIPYEILARRPGDVAACYADPSLAGRLLGWHARRDVLTMCRDAWRWQQTLEQRGGR